MVKPFARIASSSSLHLGTLVLLVALTAMLGCKNAPLNPFLATDRSRLDEDNEALTGDALKHNLLAAAKNTKDSVRMAAARTLATAADEGQQVSAQAIQSARTLARDANESVQLQAIESVSKWPVEQAGPVLLAVLVEGSPKARRAAATQLEQRWPPATGFPVDAMIQNRATAVAELKKEWVKQYGEIQDTVALARAEADKTVQETKQMVDQTVTQAKAVSDSAQKRIAEIQELVASLQEANLTAVARQQACSMLERMSMDADLAVREQAAQAMGEIADPIYLPTLMALLGDQAEVQTVAMNSLEKIAGPEASPAAGQSLSHDEKVRMWQLWYRDRQDRTAGATATDASTKTPLR